MRKTRLVVVLAIALAASFVLTSVGSLYAADADSPSAKSPAFSVSPTILTGFDYNQNTGYAFPKSFTVTASGLQGKQIVVTGDQYFGVDTAQFGEYWPSLTLAPDEDGNLQATVYVIIAFGLEVGEYNGIVTVALSPSEPGVDDQYVTCSGTVCEGPDHRYFVDFEGEGEVKTTYDAGIVTLSGLQWEMTEALIGTEAEDWKDGTRSARLRGYGTSAMTMKEDKTGGAFCISFDYRRFDAPNDDVTSWVVEYSTDQGNTWTPCALTFTPANTVRTYYAYPNTTRNIRVQIRPEVQDQSTEERRVNIDNFQITDLYDFFEGEIKEVVSGQDPNGDYYSYGIGIMGGDANYSIISEPGPTPDVADFEVIWHECLTLFGDGPWAVGSLADAGGPVRAQNEWIAVKYDGNWHAAEMIEDVAFIYVPAPPPGPREIEVLIGRGQDPTLPVTLSHFSATMTAENYVQLTWTSQSESNLLGYNVLRSNTDELETAISICPMITATNSSEVQTYKYLDTELVDEGVYYYWLQNVDMDGTTGYHGPASVIFSITGDDGGSPSIPKVTKLGNSFPNPFNPNTTIRYQLENPGNVKIDIYNQRGQMVRSFERSHDAAGHYQISWDGRDSSGKALASGVYLYRMTSGSYSATKKMVLKK